MKGKCHLKTSSEIWDFLGSLVQGPQGLAYALRVGTQQGWGSYPLQQP